MIIDNLNIDIELVYKLIELSKSRNKGYISGNNDVVAVKQYTKISFPDESKEKLLQIIKDYMKNIRV